MGASIGAALRRAEVGGAVGLGRSWARHPAPRAGGGVGASSLEPMDRADPLHGMCLAMAVTDLAEDRQGLREVVQRGPHAAAFQAS
jgi:hypothetical protein